MEWKPSITFLFAASSTSNAGTIWPAASTSTLTWPPEILSRRSAKMRKWSCAAMPAGQGDCILSERGPACCAWAQRASADAATAAMSLSFMVPPGLRSTCQRVYRLRLHDAKALCETDAERLQPHEHLLLLHAFGDQLEVHAVG